VKIFQNNVRIHAAIAQHCLYFRQVVANKTQIEHEKNNVTEARAICTGAFNLLDLVSGELLPGRKAVV